MFWSLELTDLQWIARVEKVIVCGSLVSARNVLLTLRESTTCWLQEESAALGQSALVRTSAQEDTLKDLHWGDT